MWAVEWTRAQVWALAWRLVEAQGLTQELGSLEEQGLAQSQGSM